MHASETNPRPDGREGNLEGSGEYSLEPEGATPAPARPPQPARRPSLVDDDSVDEDPAEGEVEDTLPPPISAVANPKPWLVGAGVGLGFILLCWLAGVDSLALPVPTSTGSVVPELELGDKLGGFARTLVFFPLATLAAVFGILALAFIGQRPVGDVGALFAKCAAVAAAAMLLWLVPTDVRFLKQAINTLGVPLVAGALSIPAFRLAPRDAAVATGFGLLGLALLVLGSATVMWAMGG